MSNDEHEAQAREAAREALNRHDLEIGNERTLADVLKILAAHELLSFGFSRPENTGPQPGDMRKACVVMKELASQSGALATIYMVNGLLAPLCVSYGGTTDQKSEFLPKVAKGELQLAFALTEPGAGSDAAGIATTALPSGNESYVLKCEKIYITGAATADVLLTVAKTSPDNPKAFGIVVVPKDAANLKIEPLPKIAGNVIPSCSITYDRVAVDAGNILGGASALEDAWSVLRNTGTLERLVVSAMACGLARAATNRATEFIKERQQFGRPLKDFQAVQHAVVEMATLTKGMELFLEEAIQAQTESKDPTQAISMAKYFCSEQAQRVVDIAVRVMGGRSFFDFEPVSRLHREAPFCLFAGGTVEIQKMLIARTMGI